MKFNKGPGGKPNGFKKGGNFKGGNGKPNKFPGAPPSGGGGFLRNNKKPGTGGALRAP